MNRQGRQAHASAMRPPSIGTSVVTCTPVQRGEWHALGDAGLTLSCPVRSMWFRLRGSLDADALCAAVTALRERHDVLRATFSEMGDVIRFGTAEEPGLRVHDLRRLDAVARSRRVEAIARDIRQREFDLPRGPLWRVCLLQLDDDRHELLLCLHRLICDSRSLRQLAVELGALYSGEVARHVVALPTPHSFEHHAVQASTRQADADSGQGHWRAQLEGAALRPLAESTVLRMPGAVRRRLHGVARSSIEALGDRCGSRRKALWLTILAIQVFAHSRRREVAIAVELDDQAEPLPVGLCSPVLPLCLVVDPAESFVQLLRQVSALLADTARRPLPDVDALLQQLSLPAGSRWPLAPALLRVRGALPCPSFAGLETECDEIEHDSAGFDLAMTVQLDCGSDDLSCSLAGRLGERAAHEWLVGCERLLQAVLKAPEAAIAELTGVDVPPSQTAGPGSAGALDIAPLSPDQTRRWLWQRQQPASTAFNRPAAYRLRGPFDDRALLTVIHELTRRQAGLRLTIVDAGADGLQMRSIDPDLAFERFSAALTNPDDLSALPEHDREAVLQQRIAEEAERIFGTDTEPLLRMRLFRLCADEHVLLLVGHETAVDSSSFDLFGDEFGELYAAAQCGRPPRLPELPLGLLDHAAWHSEWLGSVEYAGRCAEWRQRMADWPPAVGLPADLEPPERRQPGGRDQIHVPGWLVESLRSVAEMVRCRLDDVLLAGFALLLARWCGRDDAVVGIPLSLRDGEPLQHLIGPCTQTLPVRIEQHGEQDFLGLVAACAAALGASRQLPDLQSEDLEAARERADGAVGPLYQALFSYHDLRPRQHRHGSLDIERLPALPPSLAEPFGMWLLEHREGVSGAVLYDRGRFDPSTAALFRDQYLSLLATVVGSPERQLAELRRPAAFETDRLRGWSTGRSVPEVGADSLTARFRRVCATQPQAAAIIDIDQAWCYRQLSRAVANAAVQLRRSVAVGDVLAIALPAGATRIAAIMAGLSVGALCLLLDPTAATVRLDRQLAAGIGHDRGRRRRWLLADAELGRQLRWPSARRIDPGQLQQAADSRLELLRSPCCSRLLLPHTADNGETVLETVPERALLAIDSGLREHGVLSEHSRVAAWARPDSARSVIETLLPLLFGGAVVFGRDSQTLSDWLAHDGVDTLVADASAWGALFRRGWRGREGLTRIADGASRALPAEPQPATLLGRHYRAFGHPGAGIWSLFGRAGGPARVLPGRQVRVLDDAGDPAAIGVFGELHLQADAQDGSEGCERSVGRARWRADGSLELAVPTSAADESEPVDPVSACIREPDTPLQALLHDLWSEALGEPRFGIDDNLFELGLQPFQLASLFEQAEQKTGVNLPVSTLYRAPSIRQLAAIFAAGGSRVTDAELLPEALQSARHAWRPLVPIRPGGSDRPLFLVHGLGGNVMNYRVLARSLPASVPVYGLQAVGLDGRSTPLCSVQAMAERYLEEIVDCQPRGPYRLGGSSIGGVIAFEIACRLRALGKPVELLALLDSVLPTPAGDAGPGRQVRRLLAAVRDRASEPAGSRRPTIPQQPVRSALRGAADQCAAFGCRLFGWPVPRALRQRLLVRLNARAWRNYQPGTFDGEITLFLASAGLGAASGGDPTLGWSRLPDARIRVVAVGGSQRDVIARATLAAALGAALAPAPTPAISSADRE